MSVRLTADNGLSSNYQVTENTAHENFDLDIDSWLFAIKEARARFDSGTIHALIRQMSGTFAEAVNGLVDFNLVNLAEKIYQATGKVVCLKEIVFYILANLPNPGSLNEDQLKTFEAIVSEAKGGFPEVVGRFESRISAAKIKQ